MKKLLVSTAIAVWAPAASSTILRQVSGLQRSSGLGPVDDETLEVQEAEKDAEQTVKEAEAALQEDEKPRPVPSAPLFSTMTALIKEKGLPFEEFQPKCIKHMQEVSSSLADAYGDVQVKQLLVQECRLEAEFPRTVDAGFGDVEECLRFSDKFSEALNQDRSFKKLCKHFYAASDQQNASNSASASHVSKAGGSKSSPAQSWWNDMYRAPKVTHKTVPDTQRKDAEGDASDTNVDVSRDAQDAQDAQDSRDPQIPQDAADMAYEAALRSGKSPEAAAKIAAAAASKAAAESARRSGKNPKAVQRAAAAAAYEAGLSNGMSKDEAREASADAAEGVSASSARAAESSEDTSEMETGASDSRNRSGSESSTGQVSVAIRDWLRWLWGGLWPRGAGSQGEVQTGPGSRSQAQVNKPSDVGLQESDLERLDALLRGRTDDSDDADSLIAGANRQTYTSACVVHLKKVGETIDASYSDQQAEEVLRSQCLLDKEFSTRRETFMKTQDCNLFAQLFVKARRQELLGSDASYKKLCRWYFAYVDQASGKGIQQDEALLQSADGNAFAHRLRYR